ncbi:MAG: hypothetical protein ACR2IL_00020 [Chitinophagaceae bacterium]
MKKKQLSATINTIVDKKPFTLSEKDKEYLKLLRNLPYDTSRIGQGFSMPISLYKKKNNDDTIKK